MPQFQPNVFITSVRRQLGFSGLSFQQFSTTEIESKLATGSVTAVRFIRAAVFVGIALRLRQLSRNTASFCARSWVSRAWPPSSRSMPGACSPPIVFVSHVQPDSPARVSHTNAPQECPKTPAPQECSTRVAGKNVLQKCPTTRASLATVGNSDWAAAASLENSHGPALCWATRVAQTTPPPWLGISRPMSR